MLNLLQASECPAAADGGSLDMRSIAAGMVEHVVCTAERLLSTDPGHYFLYKRPVSGDSKSKAKAKAKTAKVYDPYATTSSSSDSSSASSSAGSDDAAGHRQYENSSNSSASVGMTMKTTTVNYDDSTSSDSDDESKRASEKYIQDHFHWTRINEFEYMDVVSLIRDYVSLWRLTVATLCEMVTPEQSRIDVPPLGATYYVDAHFSKPTPTCPNPLAVAKVHFQVHVSRLLPRHYPVMVTYRFEGYRNVYYALGERCLRSLRFQRFYIDTILATKLAFYAEICELRHPRLHDNQHQQRQHSLLHPQFEPFDLVQQVASVHSQYHSIAVNMDMELWYRDGAASIIALPFQFG